MTEPKKYELAYLLSYSVPEEEILTWTKKLTALVEESHGLIRKADPPKKRQLAYMVNKQKNAYFGWTTFMILPEKIQTLEKKLKTVDNLMRHIIVEEEIEKLTPIFRPVSSGLRPPYQKPTAPIIPKPEEKFDLEALDKKLEEIFGK